TGSGPRSVRNGARRAIPSTRTGPIGGARVSPRTSRSRRFGPLLPATSHVVVLRLVRPTECRSVVDGKPRHAAVLGADPAGPPPAVPPRERPHRLAAAAEGVLSHARLAS